MRSSVEKFGVGTAARVVMVRVAGEMENVAGDFKGTLRKPEEEVAALAAQGFDGPGSGESLTHPPHFSCDRHAWWVDRSNPLAVQG